MNDCKFLGRIVFAPERVDLKNDVVKANFRIAVDRPYKNKDGERDSDFFDCVAWNDRAELILKNFDVGDAILVHSEAVLEQWKDKETDENRSKVVFNVSRVEFLPLNPKGKNSRSNSKNDEDEEEAKPKSRASSKKVTPKAKAAKRPWESEDEDDSEE